MSTECSCHAIVAALEKRDINYAAHVHLGGGCAPVAIEGQGSPVLKATLAAVFYVVGTEHFFKNNSDRLMGKAALRHCVLAKHGPCANLKTQCHQPKLLPPLNSPSPLPLLATWEEYLLAVCIADRRAS
ncbi:hypothetical protein WJX77_001741 [Trebouxia sp. C0004]